MEIWVEERAENVIYFTPSEDLMHLQQQDLALQHCRNDSRRRVRTLDEKKKTKYNFLLQNWSVVQIFIFFGLIVHKNTSCLLWGQSSTYNLNVIIFPVINIRRLCEIFNPSYILQLVNLYFSLWAMQHHQLSGVYICF